jgi:hypothetical protein
MYELLSSNGNTTAQLIRMDHVSASFARTGRNWDVVTTVVAGPVADEPKRSAGELAAVAASLATTLSDPNAVTASATPYYQDAAYLLLDLFSAAQRQGKLVAVNAAFHRLAGDDAYRVHKLLVSLKRGRQLAVLEALLAYESPVSNELDWRGGTLDGTVDEGCLGDLH